MLTPFASAPAPLLRFGRAELDRTANELRIDGKRAPIGPRAVALLAALVENRHRPVSKHELLDTVWRGVVVEENNLQVQVSTLRRLLDAQAIATVPGRGYRFMLDVEGDRVAERAAGGTPEPGASAAGNLPDRLPELYGREQDHAAVCALVRAQALVSIVGAAGIGKTRLGLDAAHALRERFADGVWLVELFSLNDAQRLPQAIAQALRLTLPGLREPADELAAALREQQALLLLDNCEHLIDDLGPLIARLLSHTSVRLLTTSQEPLRLAGEHVLRLAPLSVPADALDPDPAAHGAVRLFVERVRALLPRFALDAAHLEGVIDVCRRLDGLPLAIELAAARVPVLGVDGVRERLGERFRLLSGGSRMAPKRHQTLRAALDWSHALLEPDERAVYRRLGTFVGSFALESAQELAAADAIDPWAVLEHLGSLVDKSLVLTEGEGDSQPRYRMLESTREHALEQLAAAGETDAWLRRHARVTWHALQRAIQQRRMDLVDAEMSNVRIAYDFARSPQGEPADAVALATLPAMVIAVEGAVDEARQRLLDVLPLVDDSLPPLLQARYWQWLGRIGLGGRLPPSRCIDALQQAERRYAALGNLRHVHACCRHAAEAMLDAGDLDGAAAALARAAAMETDRWPVADRMRRMRVEGLLLWRSGRIDEALRRADAALALAQQAAIDRYELVLLDDIARMHLEAGHAGEAAARYRTLAARARRAPNAGLTLSNALAGLIAALTANGELDDAEAVARDAVPVLSRSGILVARADILAWLMARRGRFELAARLLGASNRFRAACETARDPIERGCHADALALVADAAGAERMADWIVAGATASEAELAAVLAAARS